MSSINKMLTVIVVLTLAFCACELLVSCAPAKAANTVDSTFTVLRSINVAGDTWYEVQDPKTYYIYLYYPCQYQRTQAILIRE